VGGGVWVQESRTQERKGKSWGDFEKKNCYQLCELIGEGGVRVEEGWVEICLPKFIKEVKKGRNNFRIWCCFWGGGG